MLKNTASNILSEIKSHKALYLLFGIIISFALFVRVYRVQDLLQFYYDQGRDALVIWKFLHEGKPFLIGPVTGLAGIFLGPLYYYLITPFYYLGGGDPVYPAVFLAVISVAAVAMCYLLGRDMHSRTAGLIASLIASFSYFIATASRWLSNPTPIFLSSMLLLYSMWIIAKGGDKRWWLAIALLIGMSLQFESASAVFYIPMVVIFALFNRKNLPGTKTFIYCVGLFVLTLIPQILFNLRHENILLNNFINLFTKEKAFRPITKFILEERIKYFWRAFVTKIYPDPGLYALFFTSLSASALYIQRKQFKPGVLKTLLIFVLTPIPFYTFFQGNFGNIYEYYLSGYFLPFILLFSIGLAETSKTTLGKVLVGIFLFTFLRMNGQLIKNYLTATSSTRPIALEDQRQAVDWILDDNARQKFNLEVYVPPVISYSYDYLFLWQGTRRCPDDLCGLTRNETLPALYLLYEDDPPNPDRLENWLKNYDNSTQVKKRQRFGGITVEKRLRI